MKALRYLRTTLLIFLLALVPAAAEPLNSEEDNMSADWIIVPQQGIGRLNFGLSPDEVAAMEPVYGKPGPLVSSAHVAADVEAVIAASNPSLPADVAEDMRRAAQDVANLETQNLEIDQVPILLEYRDGRLDGVTVEAGRVQAHFEGEAIFTLGALEVLSLFERANGSPGRYTSDMAAFDNIAVSLYRFSIVTPEGTVRATTKEDDAFNIRSVTLRREPYRPANELDQFVTFSFR